MLLSQIFDLCFSLCGQDNYWQISEQCSMIAWAYERGNYLIASKNGEWAVCFYAFCNFDDAKKLIETNDFLDGALVLMRRQIRGDVIFPFLVCGKIDMIYKDFFKKHAKALGAKAMVYYKTRLKKFYMMEV